jgi:hypothetical protein
MVRIVELIRKMNNSYFHLTKLGPEYFVYSSSFQITKLAIGSTWNIPSLGDFMESLIHEQIKLIQIGELKNSKPHALITQGISKKNKHKNKGKKDQENKKEDKKKSTDESLSSKASK